MSLKSKYRLLSGLARKFYRDWRDSGCPGASVQACVNNACMRLGLPPELGRRLYERCFDPELVANGRLFALANHVTGSLLAAQTWEK
ncbi:MAG: hypothetical protein JNJ60_02735 [Rhodocyclaceae bacterium]|nr:hypothetical protein [Rhodocyclaceae bacterium]